MNLTGVETFMMTVLKTKTSCYVKSDIIVGGKVTLILKTKIFQNVLS